MFALTRNNAGSSSSTALILFIWLLCMEAFSDISTPQPGGQLSSTCVYAGKGSLLPYLEIPSIL